jgi:hypothetical protein
MENYKTRSRKSLKLKKRMEKTQEKKKKECEPCCILPPDQ